VPYSDRDRAEPRSLFSRIAAGSLGCGALGCAGTTVVVALLVAAGIWLASAAPGWVARGRAFAAREHADWPRSTALSALRTHSPDGRFSTIASVTAAEADLAESEPAREVVELRARGCRDATILLTEQFRARCQERADVLACGRPDGRLLHERFAVRARWLDAQRIEISWTELASLDPEGHRIWARAQEVHRVTVRDVSEEGVDSATWCEPCSDYGERALCEELLE
jgi:hypothetical protein